MGGEEAVEDYGCGGLKRLYSQVEPLLFFPSSPISIPSDKKKSCLKISLLSFLTCKLGLSGKMKGLGSEEGSQRETEGSFLKRERDLLLFFADLGLTLCEDASFL